MVGCVTIEKSINLCSDRWWCKPFPNVCHTICANSTVQHKLTRLPLYPIINAEEEKMDISSSEEMISEDDSPRENNSPLSPDYAKHAAKQRKGKHQKNPQDGDTQNISPNKEYNDNSDMEVGKDEPPTINYVHSQGQKASINLKNRKKLSSKSDISKDSTRTDRKFDQHPIRNECYNLSVNAPESNNIILPLIIILFIISLIASIFWLKGLPFSNVNDATILLDATTLVKNLKSEFPDQPALTYKIIRSALKNVLGPEPNYPAIILLLATNGSETVCRNFALKLVESFSIPEYTDKIYGQQYKLVNANQVKKDIETKIDKTLKDNQLGTVLIEDLDQIPGQAANIFYKYYDHEHASFKKAVFVMTVNYNKPISNLLDTTEWDNAANVHLLSAWSDTGIDQVTPLLARLTVSVAVITSKTS